MTRKHPLLSELSLFDWLDHLDPKIVQSHFEAAPSGRVVTGINRHLLDFDLWYIESGSGSVRVNGAWHDFNAEDLVAMFPGDVFEAERADVAHPFRQFYMFLQLSATQDQELSQLLRPHWPTVINMQRQPAVKKWFRQIFEWSVDPTTKRTHIAAIKGTLWLILDAIWVELENPSPPLREDMRERLRLALSFMEKNLDQPIQLTDIAAAAKLSTSALETNFRLAYGQPPVAFLLQRRLATAQVCWLKT